MPLGSPYIAIEILTLTPNNFEQETQHPLTGQQAANFRLLASQ